MPNIFPDLSGALISPEDINILEQSRKTYVKEEIKGLSTSIREVGQLQAGIVNRLTPKGARKYLRCFNRVFGSRKRFNDLKSIRVDGKVYYYIIVAGHKRLFAVKRLGLEYYRADVHYNLDPVVALDKQFSENNYSPPPPHELAESLTRHLLLKRELNDGEYPIAQFSRDVGWSPDKIRGALRFESLPLDIRNLVSGGKILYSSAVEIARLIEAGYDDKEVGVWVQLASSRARPSAEEFGKLVSKRLQEKNGQSSLFELTPEAMAESVRSRIREVLHSSERSLYHTMIGHFRDLIRLYQAGEFDLQTGRFSSASEVRLLRRLVEVLMEATIVMEAELSEEEQRELLEKLRTTDMVSEAYLEHLESALKEVA